MSLRVLSYNIHKGFAAGNRRYIGEAIKDSLHALDVHLVFLQEVVGKNEVHQKSFAEWPAAPQYEYFRSQSLDHACYGRNMSYQHGHHGNAVLSAYPFESHKNIDISVFKFEPRGFIHSVVEVPHFKRKVHSICVHLGLLEHERRLQARAIACFVEKEVPAGDPLIVLGDFNDWREKLSPYFAKQMGLKEAFLEFYGSHARTFPSWMPFTRLDRIYYRNLVLKKAERLVDRPWNRLSDHLPILAEFDIP